MHLKPGTSLGPYTIVDSIAAGGMGEVYRAQDPRLGREVAIKIIGSAPDDDRLSRFEREARATAVLKHPNIVTVFDIGTHEGLPFLVSEFLEGQTLRGLLSSSPIEPRKAAELAHQLAHGVSAAHSLRIIHRDLKPDNLFLTEEGTLKILDFGLAKLKPDTFPKGESATNAPTVQETDSGTIMGTLGYMSPEQLRGDPIDERADIFAIGTILYEMITGDNPFRRRSSAETIAAILKDMPTTIDEPGIAGALARIAERCLQKDPSDRFQSSHDLAFALETISRDVSPAGEAKPKPDRSANSIAVLPFVDMSPTRDQDHFCEGIADELINALTHVDGLRVASRSSSFQFSGSAVDIRAAGARLGVETVLEGSVRKAGDRLRVTVQLINVADGYHRWSDRYDRKLEDVFAIQDEIAESVATALRGILTPQERQVLRRPEASVEAYEYFLRGRQHFNRHNRADYEAATQMFNRTIELDPNYAPAYALLATIQAWIVEWWGGGPELFAAADQASAKAVELAPDLAEAQASRGFILSLHGKHEEAAAVFEAAIRLNPNSFEAHYLYARMCFATDRIEESAALFRKAGAAMPEDFQSMILLGQSLRVLGRHDEAKSANREGVRRAERQLELNPGDVRALSLGANALDEDGQRERAIRWSERAIEIHPDDLGVLLNGACLRARWGMKDEALALLERVFAKGFGKREWVERDPDYDSLRDDPRFKAMLDKLA
jgi:non-specific serine/threonine protein kinase